MKIHPTAIIERGAEVHPEAEIGPWCTVGAHVKIGKGTRLISHVVVDGHTTIGEHNVIFPFAVLGAVPQDLKYKGETTQLIVGDHNTIRESVTLNLGTVQGGGKTVVGSHNLLMAYTHVGHDCIVGDHVIIANGGTIAGHVTVEDYANIGGLTGVVQFARIGAHCYIAGQSGVDRDVPPFTVVMGQRPCSVKGANIVGLRRRGFTADTITKINEAIKLWSRPDVEKKQCLAEISLQYGDLPEVARFLAFIESSEAGVLR